VPNSDTDAAWKFHEATKLSYIKLKTKPALYKSYSGLPQVVLPSEITSPNMPALQAVAAVGEPSGGQLDLKSVAQLLHYSAGLIRKSNLPSAGEVHYRAAASAGALYPIEVYLVCGDLPGLDAGVYHFAPDHNALVQLRRGDFRGNLTEAAANEEAVSQAPAIVVFTAVFWRSAWKYRTRGYRYCFWDNGTVLSNLLAVSHSLRLPARVVAGFVDDGVDRLLGVDPERESATCLVPIGAGGAAPQVSVPLDEIECGNLGDEHRLVYPESQQLNEGSRLSTQAGVSDWRGSPSPVPDAEPDFPTFNVPSSEALGSSIGRRGSTRRFAREPISENQLMGLLTASTSRFAADYRSSIIGGRGLIDTYLIVNSVDGLAPGAYFYSPAGLELLKEGEFREDAGHLCFEQALGADASAVAFFLADLEGILDRFGNRGYRTAQLEAGILGGRMYLSSHSLGLGATGMTFFDDAVTAFFSPHAAGKSLMFLVGLGVTGDPNRVKPFRSRIGMLKDSLARGAGGGRRPVPDWLYD
jgi:SagB-type dehydrogenase family enzyme